MIANLTPSFLLKSDELVHRIQKKDTETKLAKLVLFVEISNFTKDCLKGEDLSIINGESDPLIFGSQRKTTYQLHLCSKTSNLF